MDSDNGCSVKRNMSVSKVTCYGLLLASIGILIPEGVHAVTNAQAAADYHAGSGLPIGKLAQIARVVAIGAGLILAIWAIVSALRASSTGNGDSFDMLTTIIRGCILPLVIVVVLGTII